MSKPTEQKEDEEIPPQDAVYLVCVICHETFDTTKGYYNLASGPRCQDCGEPEKAGFYL